jgi:hypothetical protein
MLMAPRPPGLAAGCVTACIIDGGAALVIFRLFRP